MKPSFLFPTSPFVLRTLYFVLAALSAALSSEAADAGFTLGVPGAPVLRLSESAADNAWLSANPYYPAMSIVAPGVSGVGVSAMQVAGEERVRLAASEAGFPLERTKPEYYLGDQIEPPANVDWPATYARYLADKPAGFLFDPVDNRVFTTAGGTLGFTWVLADGSAVEMTYVASASCSGRPRRIYWTDYPYNGPSINLSGKFVKFFGPDELLKPVYGVYTNSSAGIEQVLTNRVVSGLWLDKSTQMLYAYGQLQGQVVMAYYDTGLYERLLHVQAVEICRPAVNRMTGEIGRALKPDGRGYDITGLRAQPTYVTPPDNRGDYYYQHQGRHSYSPKHGYVYPLRTTKDAPWNMEVYWMETDEMLVDWPFELDQYACDWPKDATVFVRGDQNGDGGRPVYVPNDFSASLMDYQEPEGHARAVASDGSFNTVGEGWSLLRLTAGDDIWFVPVHSVLRSNADFFTLKPEDVAVGRELKLRGGSVAGLADGFAPVCDPDSPGSIYRPTSDPIWNPRIYADAQPDGADTNAVASASSSDTNKYDSVVYAVRPGTLEVWWNTSVLEEGMPKAIEIPTLPQVYSARWPQEGETPQIVIASQLGSASASLFSHNAALYLASTNSTADLPARQYFDPDDGGTLMFWMKLEGETKNVESSFFAIRTGSATDDVYDYVTMDVARGGVYGNGFRGLKIHRQSAAGMGGTGITSGPEDGSWHNVAVSFWPDGSARIFLDAAEVGYMEAAPGLDMCAYLNGPVSCALGKTSIGGDRPARPGVNLGEILLWNRALTDAEIALEFLKAHTGREPGLTGCYTFIEGRDLAVTGTDKRTFTEKILSLPLTAVDCLLETAGPPAIGTGVIDADADTTPTVYAQNDKDAIGYNPNEEHALVMAGSGGYVAATATVYLLPTTNAASFFRIHAE